VCVKQLLQLASEFENDLDNLFYTQRHSTGVTGESKYMLHLHAWS